MPGDIVLQEDNETCNEILICKSERGSKTRRGNGDTRAFNPTAQATNNERCPVYYHKKFKSHRAEEINNAHSPFYLTRQQHLVHEGTTRQERDW